MARDERDKALLAVLEAETERPIPAAELARRIGITTDRESQRKAIRRIIARLRHREGHKIAAVNHDAESGGYFMARHPGEWRRYLAARRSGGVATFAQIRRIRERATDRASGQREAWD